MSIILFDVLMNRLLLKTVININSYSVPNMSCNNVTIT